MIQSLMESIVSRWNAADLDGSICKLYPAGESRGRRNAHGTPAGGTLPRAEYWVESPAPVKSRGSRVYQAVCTVWVWGDSSYATAGYAQSIRGAFVNADRLMSMSDGDVLDVDEMSVGSQKVDDDVFMGQVVLLIRVRIDNEVPT